MQNQLAVHASVALLALLALVLSGGGLGPLAAGVDWLYEQMVKVVHVEFWMRLVGAPDFSAVPRP